MEYTVGNIFCRPGEIVEGGRVEGHTHNFDHATFCTSGVIKVTRTFNGQTSTTELAAGALPLLIKAEYEHTLEAVDGPATYICIYSHRTPQGDVSERYTGWTDAYV